MEEIDNSVIFLAVISWILLAIIVSFLGKDRKIGYLGTFILSLLLSPIFGVIFAFASERKVKNNSVTDSPEVKIIYSKALKEHKNGNYVGAIELLHKAQGLSPNSKLVLLSLAVCYSGLNNKEKGFYFLEKAVAKRL